MKHLPRHTLPSLLLGFALILAAFAARGSLGAATIGAAANGTGVATTSTTLATLPGTATPADTPVLQTGPAAAPTAASPAAAGTPVRGAYQDAADLSVQYTFPATNDVQVDAQALVYVQFSKPVALLSALEQQSSQSVLSFDPTVAGTGKWLTSALYTFKPDPGLAPDTTYTVQVQPNLSSLPGGTLTQPYSWAFSTVKPAVSDVSPRDSTQFVDPTTAVQVLFNQPMDRGSVEAAFSVFAVTGDATRVAGVFAWTSDQTFVFQPSSLLPRNAIVHAALAAGAQGAGSLGSGTANEFRWSFAVSPLPKIVSTSPTDGSQSAPAYGVSVTFSAPMDHASTEAALTIDPAPDPDHVPSFYWNADLTLYINYNFQPSSTYRITIGAGATDRYGTKIVAPASFSFTTAAPAKPQPFVTILAGSQGTLSAYLPASLYFASQNVSAADFTLYSLTDSDFRTNRYTSYPSDLQTPPDSALLRRFTVPVANAVQDQEVQNQLTVGDPLPSGGTLAPGLYLLDAHNPGPGLDDRVAFEVTRTGLVVKRGADDSLVWAVDLKDGTAVAGAPVTILGSDGASLATGTTGADGTAHISIPRPETRQNSYTIFAELSRPGDVALATQQWSDGANPYSLDIPVSYYPQVTQHGYFYTDRPIYRAGETVHLRFVTRTDDDGNYNVPQDLGDVSLQVTDSRGRNVD
ncbi:MAG: Ig-like domain-containing domain, partial [Dehalococcoidia bacterium]